MKRKSKWVAARSSLFLLTQCLQVMKSCWCLVRRPLSVTSIPKSFPDMSRAPKQRFWGRRCSAASVPPMLRCPSSCWLRHLSDANELSYLVEDVTLNKTAEMNLSFEAFETTSKDEDFQRSSRELGAHVLLMVNRSWVLNSRRSFENLVLRVCPCWGGSEEQLAALCLRKRQILPFLLKMRCDGFEDNVQNLGLL
ncbi:mitochondrial import receptor subunit TOM20 homolog isoform X2 [Anser cygnoides]|uniref:mitochondrial import receptor subunit TOM20 homolog isoform X2 n=1 Tax=Anser cygnoides TaxID=8845 RepID=UPI0034D2BEA7